ncbi:YfiR family protein [Lampropedia puyangensis]|nr:YfiR family protein [Lampropedia puyangensis]
MTRCYAALLVSGLCLAPLLSYAQAAVVTDSPTKSTLPADNSAATGEDAQVARVIAGMLGYTYWPEQKSKRTLCVVAESSFANQLQEHVSALANREQWETKTLQPPYGTSLPEGCDALYLTSAFAQAHASVLSSIQNLPVMTVIENSPFCDEGAVFCLDAKQGKRITFQVNLDAMALSTLRVNPQVLRMGREQERSAP